MFDKIIKLAALVLLALLVYFDAQRVEVGRFQFKEEDHLLVDTRAGRVYYISGQNGARLVADVANVKTGQEPQSAAKE